MWFFKSKSNSAGSELNPKSPQEELYGKAWRKIVKIGQRAQGLKIMKQLDAEGYSEASLVLGMFPESQAYRKEMVKKASEMGNTEGMWEYSGFLNHSYYPSMDNPDDKTWVETVLNAAELGSVDAMNEMGNICNRWGDVVEATYWYAMAMIHGHNDANISLKMTAREWLEEGKPDEYEEGTQNFDKSRFRCALAYLGLFSGKGSNVTLDELIKYTLSGTALAAYLAAEMFDENNDYEMEYKMYNAISFENAPHGLKCYADMLNDGKGVEKDKEGALRFYRMAAEKGDREAMYIMGELTEKKDKNMAAYWYGLSHTRGYEAALSKLIEL